MKHGCRSHNRSRKFKVVPEIITSNVSSLKNMNFNQLFVYIFQTVCGFELAQIRGTLLERISHYVPHVCGKSQNGSGRSKNPSNFR